MFDHAAPIIRRIRISRSWSVNELDYLASPLFAFFFTVGVRKSRSWPRVRRPDRIRENSDRIRGFRAYKDVYCQKILNKKEGLDPDLVKTGSATLQKWCEKYYERILAQTCLRSLTRVMSLRGGMYITRLLNSAFSSNPYNHSCF